MRCTTLLYSIAVLAAIGTSIIFFLDTLPENVKFTAFNVSPPKDLVQNNVLNNVERLFQDEIKGPEGFEVLNGDLYTTVHGGHVVKVYEDQLVPVVKFGEPCGNKSFSKAIHFTKKSILIES